MLFDTTKNIELKNNGIEIPDIEMPWCQNINSRSILFSLLNLDLKAWHGCVCECDSINQNIDKVLDDAPTKLKVSVTVSDANRQKISQLFAEQREWTINENRKCFREINDMLAKERKDVQKRYKEYNGCYLGYYVQWFFWFFIV